MVIQENGGSEENKGRWYDFQVVLKVYLKFMVINLK